MNESQLRQANVVVLRWLAVSPKSRNDLQEKLRRKGFSDEVITLCLDGLEKAGIVSDAVFADQLLTKFRFGKISGKRKIAFELKKHRIKKETAENLLDGISEEEELQRAQELASQRWDRLLKLPVEKRKKRVYDFLNRRGFDFNIARHVMDNLTRERKLNDEN